MQGLHPHSVLACTDASDAYFQPANVPDHTHDLRQHRTLLQLNPFAHRPSDSQDSDSPSPSSICSPSRPQSSGSENIADDDDIRHPATGPQRTKASELRNVPEKRKRCRVNPQQLMRLEQIFAQERSPTAARRKEISEELGMQERQTQIWFQNRLAIRITFLVSS
jgi:hypothetical protein